MLSGKPRTPVAGLSHCNGVGAEMLKLMLTVVGSALGSGGQSVPMTVATP